MASWVLSPLAREELEDILDYIAVESGSAAEAEPVRVLRILHAARELGRIFERGD